jgi:DNA repair photolyase
MGDGDSRRIADLRVGEVVYGTELRSGRRRLVRTLVSAHWRTEKEAYRVTVAGGTSVVASGDHRFLTRDGWKHVAHDAHPGQHPGLTSGDELVAIDSSGPTRRASRSLERGYLCGAPRRASSLERFVARRVASVERLGMAMPMYDITTGTGDFIANGLVSHNCYARPSHQYLGFGAGTDFERKIVVKVNAPEALRETLERRSWKGELVAISGNTDCYQPLEASYGLTRRCLETCLEYRNPVCVITKGILVRRDVDVLAALAREASVRVHVSIPFADARIAKEIEPGVAAPVRRFEAMKALADAGVPVGLALAPMIPGLNDSQVPELLRRAKDAGATSAFTTMVRLSGEVLPVFTERLRAAFPDRAEKVLSQIRDVRGGNLNDTTFHDRMHGRGPRWDAIADLFQVHVKRLGLDRGDREEPRATFRRPSAQGTLFET